MTLSWEDLASATLRRQFGAPPGPVERLVDATGPMQTQTARAAFIGLAARFPGVGHAEVTEAYDAMRIVRGSTIRGTVHTATPEQFAALGAATRTQMRRRWSQLLGVSEDEVAAAWASIEASAREWRTPEELREHLTAWLLERRPDAEAATASPPGRYLAFSHGGLVRRPASGKGWEGQGQPVYRAFDPPAPARLADVVRLHLTAHGPASRHDVAWWSGLALKEVDRAVDELGLVGQPGPDGRVYLDVGEAARAPAPSPADLDGVRLLPEFDALLCAYDPKARERFVAPEHHARLWNAGNGLMLSPLLVDGRITGWWRSTGSAKRRPLAVGWFAGTRRPRKAELEQPVAALEKALGISVTEVSLSRV